MERANRILVVEDDETLRETLGEVMTDEGYSVRLASNGFEALEHVDGWDPDVVILDLMMPRMDAYEFRRRQLEGPTADSVKVLVLSAARDIEAASSRLAADAWLAKPFTLSEMMDTVARLLDSGAPSAD